MRSRVFTFITLSIIASLYLEHPTRPHHIASEIALSTPRACPHSYLIAALGGCERAENRFEWQVFSDGRNWKPSGWKRNLHVERHEMV